MYVYACPALGSDGIRRPYPRQDCHKCLVSFGRRDDRRHACHIMHGRWRVSRLLRRIIRRWVQAGPFRAVAAGCDAHRRVGQPVGTPTLAQPPTCRIRSPSLSSTMPRTM